MPQIQAVLFDIGNVLVEWQPEAFYDREIGAARRKALFAETGLEAANAAIDAGAPFRETIYAEAARHPAWSLEIRAWHDRWAEIFAPPIDLSVRLLRALRHKRIPVYALSNFGAESYEIAERLYPFLTEFDRHFISGRIGKVKPDAAIYAHIEQDTGHAPETLLFADDRADNIAAAAARGWHTHLFADPEAWAARLVAEGLLTESEAQ